MSQFLFDITKGITENTQGHSRLDFLKEQAAQVRQQLLIAEETFNLAQDEALLDATIYQIKALNLYYQYLLSMARAQDDSCIVSAVKEERISEVMG
ncbi:MAG: DUF2508 family protein [Angelakisella sp.]|nr:DUF2508 family protein [Angelakisella sp.]